MDVEFFGILRPAPCKPESLLICDLGVSGTCLARQNIAIYMYLQTYPMPQPDIKPWRGALQNPTVISNSCYATQTFQPTALKVCTSHFHSSPGLDLHQNILGLPKSCADACYWTTTTERALYRSLEFHKLRWEVLAYLAQNSCLAALPRATAVCLDRNWIESVVCFKNRVYATCTQIA